MTSFLSTPACAGKKPARETIFDKVVTIPKELVLDIPYLPPLCDEITDLKQGFIEIKDGKLYYEEEGDGIPLALITGGVGGTHHVFHPYFSQAKDFAHIIYYDQRGTGKSSKDETGETYTIKQAVEDLESLRQALKIEKWAVLGWAHGGFIAQCYALTYPEHVIGLVLVTSMDVGLTTVKMQSDREQMLMSRAEKDAIEKIQSAMHKKELSLIQGLYNMQLAGDWKRQSYYKPTPAEFIRAVRYEWGPAPGFRELIGLDSNKINLENKFADFEIPTLIAEAGWNSAWNIVKAKFVRKNHPYAQSEYFKKSKHAVFADEPKKFFALLKKFLIQSSSAQITYKPGNRLQWPKPMSKIVRKLLVIDQSISKEEQGEKILKLYAQAVNENIKDTDTWNVLSNFLWLKEHPKECLNAMQKYEALAKIQNPEELQQYYPCIKSAQGQMLDLLGRRNEAIKCYQEALQTFKNPCNVDRKWLKEHIKKPFTWKDFRNMCF